MECAGGVFQLSKLESRCQPRRHLRTRCRGNRHKNHVGEMGFWIFYCTCLPPERLDIEGGSLGLNMKICLTISPRENGSEVNVEALADGWMMKIFPKKIKSNIEESLELFLSALERRVSGGDFYEITRDNEKTTDEDDRSGFSMPTPFNLIYKSRKKRSPRRKSRLR